MKKTVIFFTVLALSLLTALALGADLKRLNLDNASNIGPSIQTGTLVKAERKP